MLNFNCINTYNTIGRCVTIIIIDSRSKEPIYQQLKNRIIEMIGSGILIQNEQLPPVRVLARDLGVNPNTVQRAYTELETQGVIYQVMGKGSFISNDMAASNILKEQKLLDVEQELKKAKQLGIKYKQINTLVFMVYGMIDREDEGND